MTPKLGFLPGLISFCLLLSACASLNAAQTSSPANPATETPTTPPSESPAPTIAISLPQFTLPPSPSATRRPLTIILENTLTPIFSATPIPSLIIPSVTSVSSTPVPTATTVSALPIVLPTNGATPETAWRPPLYPTPWALAPYDHFYFARPLASNIISWPIADYRYGGVFFRPDVIHSGIDLPAEVGTPVQAAGSGTVVWAGWGLFNSAQGYEDDPYGLAVAIRHDFGYKDQLLFTIYSHLSEMDVVVGQVVGVGDILGKVGTTGFTTGPHLHFEVRVGANDFFSTRNPELWLVPPEGWGVLAARVMDTYAHPLTSYAIIVHSDTAQRSWIVKTYGGLGAYSDPYYNENLILSDLPAGVYEVNVPYAGLNNRIKINIFPGLVTYFTFQGFRGYITALPPLPGIITTPTP